MRAPGEGAVASAVTGKIFGGSGGEEFDLSSRMDEKARAHEDALDRKGLGKKSDSDGWTGKKGTVDLGEALAGRGAGVVLAAEE